MRPGGHKDLTEAHVRMRPLYAPWWRMGGVSSLASTQCPFAVPRTRILAGEYHIFTPRIVDIQPSAGFIDIILQECTQETRRIQ